MDRLWLFSYLLDLDGGLIPAVGLRSEEDGGFGSGIELLDEVVVCVLDCHVGQPIGRTRVNLSVSLVVPLHVDMRFPAVFQHLIFDIGFDTELVIFYLLVDMAITIVAGHIDVDIVLGILIIQFEIAKAFAGFVLGIIMPKCKSVVGVYFGATAQMEQQVGFVHAEIVDGAVAMGVECEGLREKQTYH